MVADIERKDIRGTLWCESNWRQYKKDGTLVKGEAGEIGIAQILPNTWSDFNLKRQKEGLKQLNIASTSNQLEMIQWAFDHGYQNLWMGYKKYKKGLCVAPKIVRIGRS